MVFEQFFVSLHLNIVILINSLWLFFLELVLLNKLPLFCLRLDSDLIFYILFYFFSIYSLLQSIFIDLLFKIILALVELFNFLFLYSQLLLKNLFFNVKLVEEFFSCRLIRFFVIFPHLLNDAFYLRLFYIQLHSFFKSGYFISICSVVSPFLIYFIAPILNNIVVGFRKKRRILSCVLRGLIIALRINNRTIMSIRVLRGRFLFIKALFFMDRRWKFWVTIRQIMLLRQRRSVESRGIFVLIRVIL